MPGEPAAKSGMECRRASFRFLEDVGAFADGSGKGGEVAAPSVFGDDSPTCACIPPLLRKFSAFNSVEEKIGAEDVGTDWDK